MLAVRFHQYGDPAVLKLERVPAPEPAPGWVLVRVRACALNHLDIWNRKGLPRPVTPLPHILGADVAGEVAGLGDGVSGLQTGSRVIINPGISCGRCHACLRGQDHHCPEYQVLGNRHPGGYAEYVTVPAANVTDMPAGLSFSDAASIPLVFLTAWHMCDRARLNRGESVLVMGAGGGVGTAAIQVARLHGARVIAVTGSAAKAERLTALGADQVILHGREDVSARARALTDGEGVDVVIENVGEAVWPAAVKSMARGGRLVTCGATSGPHVNINLLHLFAKEQSLLGSYMGSKSDLLDLLPYVAGGRLRPVVDQVLPLSEAAAAHRLLEERQQLGKVVLVP
ncbi:MAG: zinc-binding dehydrogenase [Thermaerobacterales bacterium]